jgi:acyl dehydratase
MPLASSIVNTASEPAASEIDARWTMAYAAALGDSLSAYMDTLRPAEFVAHPMFPVCFEWPLIVAMRRLFKTNLLSDEEATRGVHATHDLVIHRAIHPPETLHTRLVVAGVERRKPGAYQLTRLDTTDARNNPVCTSFYGSIYRGVAVEGPDRTADISMPPAPADASVNPPDEIKIVVPAGMAHVYTECARIFNPIHTDAAVARAAGLPAIILHGTATLALAVSRIVEARAQSDPTRISRIACRFGAMVTMPSTLTLRIFADRARDPASSAGIFFEVLNNEGKLAIRDGFVGLRAAQENSNREN